MIYVNDFYYFFDFYVILNCSEAKLAYEKLIERTGVEGQVMLPEVSKPEIDVSSVEKMFSAFYTARYRQFIGTLKFGDELSSSVTLCPPPTSCKHESNYEVVEVEVEQTLDIKGLGFNTSINCICFNQKKVLTLTQVLMVFVSITLIQLHSTVIYLLGFLSISDVSSPPVFSRHLVLPYIPRDDISTQSIDEESRLASLCVFLHGTLF